MKSIQIKANGIYLPQKKLDNNELAQRFGVTDEYIYKRTGIKMRYITQEEKIEDMAVEAAKNALEQSKLEKEQIQMIILATTSSTKLMPGISYIVQKELGIEECFCLDLLAGCSGYINAFDIARNYIVLGDVQNALIIGVDQLSHYTNENDFNTSILLSDGAGATIIGVSEKEKFYTSYIKSEGQKGEILTCNTNQKIVMDGKQIYKYAVTQTVKNIELLLKKSKRTIKEIKMIIPHQSNQKIIQGIENRIISEKEICYSNIETIGNTFCASIPIALKEVMDNKKVKENDYIILLGYGGGLNTGSILLQL